MCLNTAAENLLQRKFLGEFGDFLEFVEGDDNRFVAKVVRQLLWQIQDLGDGGGGHLGAVVELDFSGN